MSVTELQRAVGGRVTLGLRPDAGNPRELPDATLMKLPPALREAILKRRRGPGLSGDGGTSQSFPPDLPPIGEWLGELVLAFASLAGNDDAGTGATTAETEDGPGAPPAEYETEGGS